MWSEDGGHWTGSKGPSTAKEAAAASETWDGRLFSGLIRFGNMF